MVSACELFIYGMWNQVPWPGVEPRPPSIEIVESLAIGPPGKSPLLTFSAYFFCAVFFQKLICVMDFIAKPFVRMRPKVRLWIRLVSLVSYPPHFETIPVMNVVFFGGVTVLLQYLPFLKNPQSVVSMCTHRHTHVQRVIWGWWVWTSLAVGPVCCLLFAGRKAFKACFTCCALTGWSIFPSLGPSSSWRGFESTFSPSQLQTALAPPALYAFWKESSLYRLEARVILSCFWMWSTQNEI